jgi:hypothetical protein
MSDIPPETTPGMATPQRRFILIGGAGGLIFLALVCVALGIVLASRSRSPSTARGGTPTPLPASPAPPPIISGPSGSVPLTLTAPSLLEVKGHKFEIIPVEVTKGTWSYPRNTLATTKAVWVYGTLVNYVIGLEANSDNTALLRGITEADPIKLTALSGKVFSFRYSGSQWVTVDKTDVFRQMRPGMTLVLLGEKGDQRWVVSAIYVAADEVVPPGDVVARVGTLVNVSGAQVMALGGKLVKNVAGLPAGSAYYLADFTVTGSGGGVLDASLFQMELVDASGKRYAMSVPASLAGSYGPPGGQLLPGTTLTATAGFVVPESLPGTSVIWTFSPQSGALSPARFQLPIADMPPTPEPRDLVVVQLTGARYSSDATQVIVSGGIGNTSKQAVTVSLSDINLQAGGSLVPVKSTDPQLPWALQPGQNLAFTIQFARPPAGTATFRMMQSSFELSGLQ